MNRTKKMILIALFTSLTAVGAFIRIPLPFVPITMQTFFVMMAGLILGKKGGSLSQLLYVVLGLIGIPIFTEGGGPGYILKPSFGYLLGFIVGAYVIGMLIEGKEVNFKNTVMASLGGLLVINLIGVPYLYLILSQVMNVQIGFYGALKAGMLTFLPGDLLKIFILGSIVPTLHRRIKNYV